MKKLLSVLLCGALLLVCCAGVADTEGNFFKDCAILEVREDGSLLCESDSGEELTVLVSEDTQNTLPGGGAVGMIVEVWFPGTDFVKNPSSNDYTLSTLHALSIRNKVYIVAVTGVAAESAMVRVKGSWTSDMWVKLPKAAGLDALEGKYIAFEAYGLAGKSIAEVVRVEDYTVVEKLAGTVTEIGDGYMTADIEGKTVRVVLTEETQIPVERSVGHGVEIFFAATDEEDVPEEVIAIGVYPTGG